MEFNSNHFFFTDNEFPLCVKQWEHSEVTRSHSHAFIELVFVARGFTMHRAEKNICLMLPGDIFFIPPGMEHEYWKSVNNIVYNCLFSPEVLGDAAGELSELPFLDKILTSEADSWDKFHLKPDNRYEILGMLKKLEYEGSQKLPGWPVRSKALFIDLLVCLSRMRAGSHSPNTPGQNGASRSGTIAGEIVQIMELSLKNKISIEDMAKSCGYSPDHYSRLFKSSTGLSPSAYITSMRIANAAEKLLDPSFHVSRAAEEAGFDDVNYFSRLFKKETGKTPSQFRSTYLPYR